MPGARGPCRSGPASPGVGRASPQPPRAPLPRRARCLQQEWADEWSVRSVRSGGQLSWASWVTRILGCLGTPSSPLGLFGTVRSVPAPTADVPLGFAVGACMPPRPSPRGGGVLGMHRGWVGWHSTNVPQRCCRTVAAMRRDEGACSHDSAAGRAARATPRSRCGAPRPDRRAAAGGTAAGRAGRPLGKAAATASASPHQRQRVHTPRRGRATAR